MQYSPSLARTLQGTCAVSGLRKRSVVLAGHATSVALEPEFWAVLDRIAARRSLSKAQLLADILEVPLALGEGGEAGGALGAARLA